MSRAAAARGGPSPEQVRRAAVVGILVFAGAAVVGLTWAKWWPYADRTSTIWSTDAYPGSDTIAVGGSPGHAPSLSGAWDFTTTYASAVWQALVVAIVLAAVVETFLPRRWLVRALSSRGRTDTFRGGACSLPTMMCTCCTAPITATLRRSGVSTSSALAFWVGNPLLNPAVLVFLAILLPWQWLATRVVVGAVVVFGLTALVAHLSPDQTLGSPGPEPSEPGDLALSTAPGRFGRSLLRLSLTLLPEYAVVVFGVGLLSGWLFPFDGSVANWSTLAAVLAAVVGTLLVIPTAGEIPVVQGLAAAGVGPGVLGALLITLPAISLPSMAMVVQALTWRVTAAMAGAVCLAGIAGGVLLSALS